jgi:hypothetical protein
MNRDDPVWQDDYIPDPDPPDEFTCDACGKVLPRFHGFWLCDKCDSTLKELMEEERNARPSRL